MSLKSRGALALLKKSPSSKGSGGALTLKGGSGLSVNAAAPDTSISLIDRSGVHERTEQFRLEQERMQRKAVEAEYDRVVEDLGREVRLKLAVALDYTASTSGDVSTFKRNVDELLKRLGERFLSVYCVPSVVSGKGPFVGKPNEFSVFEKDNYYHTYFSPPLKGIEKSFKKYPELYGTPDDVSYCVAFGDCGPEQISQGTIRRLNEAGVFVNCLVSNCDLAAWESYILGAFGENGMVIERQGARLDVVSLVVESIIHRRNLLVADAAEEIMRERKEALKMQRRKPVSLRKALEKKGITGAGRLIEGGVVAGLLED